MTERERLIALIAHFHLWIGIEEKVADYLLANGVKLPATCGECEHYSAERKDDKYGVCRYWQYYTEAPEVCADEFCCHGERREDK